jgi:7,8-dihydropterin-6-yl-methyl-4-(beta-D-ribofuranosyl)aminobenzene 5'-phosphate synthase
MKLFTPTSRALISQTFVLAPLLALSLSACAGTSGITGTSVATPTSPRITILYDAFGKNRKMKKDWGFAALVEVDGKRILFDTGDDADIFAQNVKAAGVDLRRLDFVVLSHRHGDHVSGLAYLLQVNPAVKIYAPKESFGVFGSSLSSEFYRKSEALSPEMRYFDGNPPSVMKFGSAWPGARFELIDKTTEVAPGLTLIALVSDAPGTKELKELSLAINTREGIVLVVGCSHPGIEAIVAEAAKINARIHFIAGGFHLVAAPDAVIEKVATALKETWKADWLAPGHCTGEPTFAALKRAFGDRYLYAGLGTVLELGATPQALASRVGENGTLITDETDSRTYRELLAKSDDGSDRADHGARPPSTASLPLATASCATSRRRTPCIDPAANPKHPYAHRRPRAPGVPS